MWSIVELFLIESTVLAPDEELDHKEEEEKTEKKKKEEDEDDSDKYDEGEDEDEAKYIKKEG